MRTVEERRAEVLKAIVQAYVRDGEPLGSKRLVEEWDLGVSAATVRSDMAALEDAGLIAQPHTSAGRVPTDKGYRHFVDSLTETADLQPEQRAALEGLLLGAADLEDLLRRASSVLSRVTRFAALVAAPRLDRSRLRHIELVRLAPTSVLLVCIADTGRVEKRMLDLNQSVAEHDVQRARQVLNESVSGVRLAQAADVISGIAAGAPDEVRNLIDGVADAVRAGLAAHSSAGDHVIVGGTANIAGPGYFDRLEQVKQVYEALEEHVVLLEMLQQALETGDPAIRIGGELPLVELTACSIVAAGYEAGEHAGGSIGVLGPMRMDYPRTLGAVEAVASSLEKALADLTGSRS
jgi:heat-inducible transcriptional repressor